MFGVRGQLELHETLCQKQNQNKKTSDLPHELAEVRSIENEPDSFFSALSVTYNSWVSGTEIEKKSQK